MRQEQQQELTRLQTAEKTLLSSLSYNREIQRALLTKDWLETVGVQVGDTVSFLDGRETIIGVFDQIRYRGVEPSGLIVLQLNSDGKAGKREKVCRWSKWNTMDLKKVG
jgi:hypothetical protein